MRRCDISVATLSAAPPPRLSVIIDKPQQSRPYYHTQSYLINYSGSLVDPIMIGTMTSTGTSTMLIQSGPSMVKTPSVHSIEHDGSCWTCITRGAYCDKGLPGKSFQDNVAYWVIDCQTCSTGGFICEGYSTRLHWNTTVGEESRTPWSPGIAARSVNGDRIRNPSQSQYIWNKQFPGYRILVLERATSDKIERRTSLFANYIPENPIIAASTTPLERHYLRHFLTYQTPFCQ